MILTILESPYGTRPDGARCTPREIKRNERYLNRCIQDSLGRDESPYASHGFFTVKGRLDDLDPAQRKRGIEAGLAWGAVAQRCAVYEDHAITSGMQQGIERHAANGIEIVHRLIGPEPIGKVYREDGCKLIVDVISDSTREGHRSVVLRCLEIVRHVRHGGPSSTPAVDEEFTVRGLVGSERYWPWRLDEE